MTTITDITKRIFYNKDMDKASDKFMDWFSNKKETSPVSEIHKKFVEDKAVIKTLRLLSEFNYQVNYMFPDTSVILFIVRNGTTSLSNLGK